jgi:hypothetical protein
MKKNVSKKQLDDAQEIIDFICQGINELLVNGKEAFKTRTVSKDVFYQRLKVFFEARYREMRKKYEKENNMASLFALNVIQTTLLNNVKHQDLHEVTRYVGVVTKEGKVDFCCEFN